MTPNRFENLVTLVAPLIEKRTTRFREPISASQRLALRRSSIKWTVLGHFLTPNFTPNFHA